MITYRQPFKGEYPITQQYGEVIPKVTYLGKPHTGIDYGCPAGTEILASADGIVMKSGWDITGYGNVIIIMHDAKHATLYAHLNKCSVFLNQKVRQGDVIGLSGATGGTAEYPTTGPHLHFEARRRWNDYSTHFNPYDLPLMSVEDNLPLPTELKGPEALGKDVEVVAPAGAWGWNKEHTRKVTVLDFGTTGIYTGAHAKYNGLDYCEVMVPLWVAVHDNETQILDNDGD